MVCNTYIWAILTLMVFIWFCPKYSSLFFWSDTHCSVWMEEKLTFTESQKCPLTIPLLYETSVPCDRREDNNDCRSRTVISDMDRGRQGREICNYHGSYSHITMQEFYCSITGLVCSCLSLVWMCTISVRYITICIFLHLLVMQE